MMSVSTRISSSEIRTFLFFITLASIAGLSSSTATKPTPLPQCTWKPDPGTCRAFFRRYFYSNETQVRYNELRRAVLFLHFVAFTVLTISCLRCIYSLSSPAKYSSMEDAEDVFHFAQASSVRLHTAVLLMPNRLSVSHVIWARLSQRRPF